MKTASEIAKEHIPCTCGEIYLSRNLTAPDCPYHSYDWEAALIECAKQAWASGFDRGTYEACDIDELVVPKTKEQFIQSLNQ